MITVQKLIACGVSPTQAKQFAEPLSQAFDRFGVVTVLQQAAFIAQAMHESASFARLEENLFYSRPERIQQVWPSRFPSLNDAARVARNPEALANIVYADRMGNTQPGDGWRFRGRGLFQLTGRENYARAGAALGLDLEAHPELVALPPAAGLTAAWYWSDSGCNELMASGEFDKTTRRINGGAIGATERRALFGGCCEALR